MTEKYQINIMSDHPSVPHSEQVYQLLSAWTALIGATDHRLVGCEFRDTVKDQELPAPCSPDYSEWRATRCFPFREIRPSFEATPHLSAQGDATYYVNPAVHRPRFLF